MGAGPHRGGVSQAAAEVDSVIGRVEARSACGGALQVGLSELDRYESPAAQRLRECHECHRWIRRVEGVRVARGVATAQTNSLATSHTHALTPIDPAGR